MTTSSLLLTLPFEGVNAGSTGVTFFEKEVRIWPLLERNLHLKDAFPNEYPLRLFFNQRNMFYRHKAALMYDQLSLTLASLLSEAPFILMVGMIFSVCFYFPLGKSTLKHKNWVFQKFLNVFFLKECLTDCIGFEAVASKFFLFYYFVTATVGLFTFLGQVSNC